MTQRAFTLIELLVVVGIITVAVAVTLPALNNTRQQAKSIVCQNNIAQLNIGLQQYEITNKTFPHAWDSWTNPNPPPGGYPGNPCYDNGGWWWFNFVSGSRETGFNTKSICWCPSRNISERSPKRNILVGNYGVNLLICKNNSIGPKREAIGRPLSASQVRHPSSVLLLCDAGYSAIAWWYAKNPPDALSCAIGQEWAYVPGLFEVNKQRRLRSGTGWDASNGRHLRRNINVGFVDGHIERIKSTNLQTDNPNTPTSIWVP